MIKVLIVDDSPVVRDFLTHLIDSDPEMQVIGTAADGAEAVEAVRKKKPDVVTMDLHMSGMDGCEATRLIMESTPVPIIIVSGSLDPEETLTTFRAMEVGALSVLARPHGAGHPEHEKSAREFIRTIKVMSEVRVVRRWPRRPQGEREAAPVVAAPRREAPGPGVVAIGASTGGPLVIQRMLAELPSDYSIPLLIVQHMARGFIAGFVEWLAQSSSIPVKVAVHGELVHPGCAYVAPDEHHMGVGTDGRIILAKGKTGNGHCPSVSHLFRTVAEVYGKRGVGVLLTGMGRDGAEELGMIRERGGVTIAQDEESCVVNGMPGEAKKINAATHVMSPDKIVEFLKSLGGGG